MIFFFYGPNTYAARRQLAKLVSEYTKKSGSDFGLERLDGARLKAEELRAALQAAPFLANSRLVIIENLGANKAVAGSVESHIKEVPASTVAVFYDPDADQRSTYFKALKRAAKAIKFEPLSTGQLHQWIAREAAVHNAEIERPAIGRLLELAGEDQWRLATEIAKLAAHGSPITAADVNELVEESQAESVFNLVEAMTAGRSEAALRLYTRLREDGLHEMYILTMVIWQLRNLLLAKTAGQTTPGELAKTAGMSPFVAGKMLSKRHLVDEDRLKAAFLEAVDADYRIKTGAGTADVLIEQLVYRVARELAV